MCTFLKQLYGSACVLVNMTYCDGTLGRGGLGGLGKCDVGWFGDCVVKMLLLPVKTQTKTTLTNLDVVIIIVLYIYIYIIINWNNRFEDNYP